MNWSSVFSFRATFATCGILFPSGSVIANIARQASNQQGASSGQLTFYEQLTLQTLPVLVTAIATIVTAAVSSSVTYKIATRNNETSESVPMVVVRLCTREIMFNK